MDRYLVKKELRNIISLFIEDQSNEPVVFQDDDLLIGDAYSIDSVALVTIIVEIERRFDIEIDDEYLTMDFLSSINTMADFVLDMIKEQKNE